MGTCCGSKEQRRLEVRRQESLWGNVRQSTISPLKPSLKAIEQSPSKAEEPLSPATIQAQHAQVTGNSKGNPRKSVKDIMSNTQEEQKKQKRNWENKIHKSGKSRPFPVVDLDDKALRVHTPEVPTFDYHSLFKK